MNGDFGGKFRCPCRRGAEHNQTAAAVFDPKLFCCSRVSQEVIAQVNRACPVAMLPTHGAQAIFKVHLQAQGNDIIIKYITPGRHTMAKRAVEVEEDGFDAVVRSFSLQCATSPPWVKK